jgi:hypothetical protein
MKSFLESIFFHFAGDPAVKKLLAVGPKHFQADCHGCPGSRYRPDNLQLGFMVRGVGMVFTYDNDPAPGKARDYIFQGYSPPPGNIVKKQGLPCLRRWQHQVKQQPQETKPHIEFHVSFFASFAPLR